jgi:HPt (histidine-containing phosphotransfer) domain-containing protein
MPGCAVRVAADTHAGPLFDATVAHSQPGGTPQPYRLDAAHGLHHAALGAASGIIGRSAHIPGAPSGLVTIMNPTAPETGRPEAAVLDAQALAGLSMLDPTGANKLVERVLGTYQGSLGRLMLQMSEARERGDHAAIRLAAHTLKSSSASIGALDLSRLCAAAETAVREGQADAVPRLVDDLQAEARRVAQAVQELLSR